MKRQSKPHWMPHYLNAATAFLIENAQLLSDLKTHTLHIWLQNKKEVSK